MEALDTVITHHLNDGDHGNGIDRAIQLPRMDTLREKTYRQLMQLLALSGDVTAALAQFEGAEQWENDQNRPDKARIARWSQAKTLCLLGRIDEALVIQRHQLGEFQQENMTDGYVFD